MFNLSEYRRKPATLSDWLPWAAIIRSGILLNKDGAFQRSFSFRAPDLDSATQAELVGTRARFNNVFKRLGSNWCVHVEASRVSVNDYPECSWPDKATAFIDAERKAAFQQEDAHFETKYYMTFTYLPPSDSVGKAEALLIENAPEGKDADYRRHLDLFINVTDQACDILSGFMPEIYPLDDHETVTYLHDCISTNRINLVAPEIPMYLDAVLTDTPLTGGLKLKLGDEWMEVISVRTYPGKTIPGLLDNLSQLPFEYRWVSRFIPFDRTDAEKELTAIRRHWFSKRKGGFALLMEAMFKMSSALEDSDSLNKAADTDLALQSLGEDLVSIGQFTPVIIVRDANPEILNEKTRAVRQIIDSTGMVSAAESENALEAYFGSLPGNAYANPRKPLVTSLNLCDMIPASSVWAGPAWNKHLKAPPLLITRTKGSTPFRLSTHINDVGHTMVVGPTGSGKSVLLGLLAAQWRKYKPAQIYIFDKGRSSRALTLAAGGNFFDLGEEGGLSFQPLAGIDDEQERAWAHEWLIELVEREGVTLTPEIRDSIWSTLNTLAESKDKKAYTLSLFRSLEQNRVVKEALSPYIMTGPHGALLDAEEDTLEYGSWQTFEMETLMNTKSAVLPVLTYLFHRLEQRFDGSPTLLVLDEAWLFMADGHFAAKIKEWLKVLRKKNVSVIFATQSLADITESPIATAVIESCPSRIFLPNANARDPNTRPLYESFGLNDRQIHILSTATPQREYYYQSIMGNRLFELSLGGFDLTLLASSSEEDHSLIDRLLEEKPEDYFRAFMEAKGWKTEKEDDDESERYLRAA